MSDPRQVEMLPFGSRVRTTRWGGSEVVASYEEPFRWGRITEFPMKIYPIGSPPPPLDGPPVPGMGPFSISACPYCAGVVRYTEAVPARVFQEWRRGDAIQCNDCLWWMYVWSKSKFYPGPRDVRNVVWEAVVQRFDYDSAEAPLTALRQRLATGSVDLRDLKPLQLERLVTSVFRDVRGATAKHVGRSRDGGVDVLIVDGPIPLAIQVKRRSKGGTEGPAVVRDLIGALAYRGMRRGAIVTTAETFSKMAQETADTEPLRRDGYQIELYAYDALREVVSASAPPPRPWLDLVYEHYLEPADIEEVRRRTAPRRGQR